jgi:hypothetical protein
MTGSSVDNVPRSRWVFLNLLRDEVIDRRLALVEVLVSVKDKIDSILQQEGFESCLALHALEANIESVGTAD